jgi:hypothetical protein
MNTALCGAIHRVLVRELLQQIEAPAAPQAFIVVRERRQFLDEHGTSLDAVRARDSISRCRVRSHRTADAELGAVRPAHHGLGPPPDQMP